MPIAAAMAILLLILAVIAGTGVSGTSWFDRNHVGFAAPHTMFGGKGLSPDVLGTVTLLIAPVQVLLIFFAMRGFAQGWNVEVEMPIDEAAARGDQPPAAPRRPRRPPPDARRRSGPPRGGRSGRALMRPGPEKRNILRAPRERGAKVTLTGIFQPRSRRAARSVPKVRAPRMSTTTQDACQCGGWDSNPQVLSDNGF